jgi:hypothetical protein
MTKTTSDEYTKPRRRNPHAREVWENKDFRIRVEVPKSKKRKRIRPTDILNLEYEELEDFE